MANKPLQSIQFPGLPDKYTVPQMDSNFDGVSGKIPDSKKVRDEIDSLKEDLNAEKAYDVTDWTSGIINAGTGVKQNASYAITTNEESIAPINELIASSGYKFLIFGYSKTGTTTTYLGWWYAEQNVFYEGTGSASHYYTSLNLQALKTAGATHIRVSFKNTEETDITVSAGVNLSKKISVISNIITDVSELEDDVKSLDERINDVKYFSVSDTDDLTWGAGYKVNSTKKAYASNQPKYAYLLTSDGLSVYSGSTIKVASGYTIDYSIVAAYNTASLEGALGVAGPADITISQSGILLLSVTDGTTDVTAGNAPTIVASAIDINLLVETVKDKVDVLVDEVAKIEESSNTSDLYKAQKAVAEDWRLPFIDVFNALGLGGNHQIPNTATLWSETGTTDLTQKGVWMSDGVHPFRGLGTTDMYGLTVAQQFALVSPSFHDGGVSAVAPYWTGKRFLWMGTSIPAGSDPDAGQGTGSTYPALVASYLGATATNIARGSSCVRANASDGVYTGFMFSHFIRSITRMVAECDTIASNWDSIKTNISLAPASLTEANVSTMKSHSFENLILPYLDGTNTAPDLYVIDYGHNDVRPKGIDGKSDLWIKPTVANIKSGLLAEDTYMTANNYANLKLAFDSDLSGITDLSAFAASVNRNCLQGALNFLITVILSRKPYARIVIVSDYN